MFKAFRDKKRYKDLVTQDTGVKRLVDIHTQFSLLGLKSILHAVFISLWL